jgi:hypothetical protein
MTEIEISELRELVARKLSAEESLTIEEARQCIEALRTERALAAAKTPRRRSSTKKVEIDPNDLLNQVVGGEGV